MLNSTTLEVAIGMALIYLLLSLFCTAIREAIAGIFGTRANNLERGIASLFNDGSLAARDANGVIQKHENHVVAGQSLKDALYAHGLIQSLFRSHQDKPIRQWWGATTLPSYIPSRTFAAALFDILFPQMTAAVSNPANPTPSLTLTSTQLSRMLDSLQDLPESKGKQAICTLVKQSQGDIVKTRESFESWFNDGMDRAAGWYKRRTQLVLFVVGLTVAVSLNVDSIEVGRALWISPALRSYAVTAAEKYARGSDLVPGAGENASTNLNSLQSLALPIGWNGKAYTWKLGHDDAGNRSIITVSWSIAIFGWLLTAIAMTLGAPFWFDLLNQFMVIRSTIKPREKSEIEISKD